MKNKNIITLIPARMHAKRLPNKPMALINDKPMIVHVWEKAMSADIGPVFVATDSSEIYNIIKNEGGNSVMTNSDLASGSDRIHKALEKIDPNEDYNNVINLQGDLPELDPKLLHILKELLINNKCDLATLVTEISKNEADKEQIVKTAVSWNDKNIGKAIYFSRSLIPFGAEEFWHHVGIYGWKRKSLKRFVEMKVSDLERFEKLEQLRAIEAGMSIVISKVDFKFNGIDTLDDLIACRQRLKQYNMDT